MRFNYKSLVCLATVMSLYPATAESQSTPDNIPADWLYSEGYTQEAPTADRWWRTFNDPVLDSLISLGERNNYDVRVAANRIEMARQNLRSTQSQYYPNVAVSGGWTAQRNSGMTTSHSMAATNLSYFNAGVDMSWEIDVFGKVKAQTKQGKAAVDVSRAQYDAMMVSVAARIASAYMQLRTLQAQLDVLNQHIAQQKKVTDITQARHEAGLASMLDVTQSLTTYYSTQASITGINTSIATTINAIAVLTGAYPADIAPMLQNTAPMPQYRQIVAVGVPMDLIRRRPDIAEAEHQLAGYAAALGVAKKDFLPTLRLNGSLGTMAHSLDDLGDKRSFTYNVAPTLSWTVFDGMARKAAEASAQYQMQVGIDNYNAAVLTAVQEVENAMATYYNALKYIDIVTKVTEEANRAYDLSIDLYKQGLTPFINVTTAQITYLQYANELVCAQGSALADLVSLYQALGGGWM